MEMEYAFEFQELTKRYGETVALDGLELALPRGRVAGLIGRNGSGKTTLLEHLTGLILPDRGECRTLGTASAELGAGELSRIGVVHQHLRLLEWMSVGQHLRYMASFYENWDRERERRLVAEFELDPKAKIARLSPGNQQRVALVIAVCHHPELLLLDEPVSALDPIARESLFQFLFELVQEDATTILVSSHVLRDVERLVDWVICLERGRCVVSEPLDDLHERYAEWIVTTQNGGLPARFAEPYVIEQQGDNHRRQLFVRQAGEHQREFEKRHHVKVVSWPMNLERLFPYLVEEVER